MPKVLVIEPDRVLAENLKSALIKAGYQVHWNRDLQAAVESVDQYQPAVIIMDLATGGHGGVEFLYELRSYPEWQNLPVIICSSTPLPELANLSRALSELNISSFHYKPKTSLEQIVDSIALAVERARVSL